MQIIVNFMLTEQEFLADGVEEKHTSEAMREVFRIEKEAVDKFLLAAKEMGLDLVEKVVTVEECQECRRHGALTRRLPIVVRSYLIAGVL